MTLSGRNVLLVGNNFQNARTLTDRLRRWKFLCHFVGNTQAASDLLGSQRVDLLLSNVYLPDGTGFGLLTASAHISVTAFLCLPVENSCLWLPAVDAGKQCLGLPALRPFEFARELEQMALRVSAYS
jgi:DNA-binding NtrC family response regulator